MSLISRARALLSSAAKSYAPGGWGFTPPPFWPVSWWQQGYKLPPKNASTALEACVSAISQTIASLPIHHWKMTPEGGQKRVLGSPAARLMHKPNSYQTRSDFILNLVRNELFEGNGYALGVRDRGALTSLHIVNPTATRPYVAEDGTVFYGSQLPDLVSRRFQDAGVALVDGKLMWPAEDTLHIRMQTPVHPLIGETPLTAAMMSVQAGVAIQNHMAAFFANMSRPSGYLKVPGALKGENIEKLRSEWMSSFSSGSAGRIAVLQGGLDWVPLTMSAVDSALIDSYKMSVADVARVFRVPLAVIGELGGATFNNTETLIRHWLSTGLGYIIEHIELALDSLFGLPEDEFVSFDIDYLLRADFSVRVAALTAGIAGGLFTPNEARQREGLPRVEHGDEPRLQAQLVPLSAADQIPTAPAAPAAPAAPPPDNEEPSEDAEDEEGEEVVEDSVNARPRRLASYFLEQLNRAPNAA